MSAPVLFSEAAFPAAPGIYIFRDGETVLYVGMSTNLRKRLENYHETGHYVESYFPNATVEIIEFPENEIAVREREYIKSLNPLLNGRGKRWANLEMIKGLYKSLSGESLSFERDSWQKHMRTRGALRRLGKNDILRLWRKYLMENHPEMFEGSSS